MNDDARSKVTDLLKKARTGMFTTLTSEGDIQSRPMALQETEFDGDLWFFTFDSSDKVTEISANPHVNVAISEGNNTWISLAGHAEVQFSRDKAEQLWTPVLKAWFTDGIDTQGLTLIKVHADSAEYWDSPNNAAVQLFGSAKAAITGKPAQGGENESVEL